MHIDAPTALAEEITARPGHIDTLRQHGGLMRGVWRGALPLPLSFSFINVLCLGLASAAMALLTTYAQLDRGQVQWMHLAIVLAWPALLALQVWATVGTWRSAQSHAAHGGRLGLTRAAQLALVLSAGLTLTSFTTQFLPRLGEHITLARGLDPFGRLHASMSDDGRQLHLRGPVGLGDAQRVQQLLDQSPGLRVVLLESSGGRLREALQMADSLRARHLATRAVGACDRACTLIFMGGTNRQLMPGAQLGFQRLSSGTSYAWFDRWANTELAQWYRQSGLPEGFITRVLSTPPSRLWQPAMDELAAAGVISVPDKALDVVLPLAQGMQTGDHVEALSTHAVWQAVEHYRPGSIALAALHLQTQRAAGAKDDDAQVAAQRVIEDLLPDLLIKASPTLKGQYRELLTLQLSHAREQTPQDCAGLLQGDAAARRRLSSDLTRREAAWLQDVMAESPAARPSRAPNALEAEVIHRTLGDRAQAALTNLRKPQAAPATDALQPAANTVCDNALSVLATVDKLPPAERRLATRMMLERY